MQQHAERELLSRLIQTGRMRQALNAGIEERHFRRYRSEFSYLLEYWNRHSELPSRGVFCDRFPDFRYRVPRSKTVRVLPLVEAVKEDYTAFTLAKLMEQATAEMDKKSAFEVLDMLKAEIGGLQEDRHQDGQVSMIDTILDDVTEFRRLQNGDKDGSNTAFIPSHWPAVNERNGGFRAGELVGILARINEGKSWVGTDIATYALWHGKRVFYAPLEMSRYDMAGRLHASLSWLMVKEEHKGKQRIKIPSMADIQEVERIMAGKPIIRNTAHAMGHKDLDADFYEEWANRVKERLKGTGDFILPERGAHSAPFTLQTFISHVEKSECDIAVLDYLSLLTPAQRGKNDVDWQVWRDVTRELKNTAMRLGIVIVVAAQANRQGSQNRTPELENVGYTDALGADCDRVFSIRGRNRHLSITAIKQRIGEKRYRFHAHFWPDFGMIEQDMRQPVEEDV